MSPWSDACHGESGEDLSTELGLLFCPHEVEVVTVTPAHAWCKQPHHSSPSMLTPFLTAFKLHIIQCFPTFSKLYMLLNWCRIVRNKLLTSKLFSCSIYNEVGWLKEMHGSYLLEQETKFSVQRHKSSLHLFNHLAFTYDQSCLCGR